MLVEHLEKLRYFHKLAGFRTISEAARAMRISQAGLSKSLITLESQLGVTLFQRSNAGLVLTKEGKLTFKGAESILAKANELEAQLTKLKATKSPKTFRIGMYDSIAVYFGQHLVSYIQEIYSQSNMSIVADSSSNLSTSIQNGDLDIAI